MVSVRSAAAAGAFAGTERAENRIRHVPARMEIAGFMFI
jgi:hypothetical protein